MAEGVTRVGIISDTHGLLRPEALEELRGSDVIIHAGDVGEAAILDALARLAPVHAVRGNVDRRGRCGELPLTQAVDVGGRLLYVIHILDDLDVDPVVAGVDAVVFGHTHRPEQAVRDGVLYLNPGSAGPRRFDLPVSVARLEVSPRALDARIVEIPVSTT